MEIDEKIFHFAWKTKRRFSKKKSSEYACTLVSQKSKLTNIATAFFGKITFIKQAEYCGGVIGNSLFLPKEIDLFNNFDSNYKAYLYKVLYNVEALKLGFYFDFKTYSKTENLVLSLLLTPEISKKMLENYPNLVSFRAEYYHVQYELLLKKISKKTPDLFIQIWQLALLNPQILKESHLNDAQLSLIHDLINIKKLDPNEIPQFLNEIFTKIKLADVELKGAHQLEQIFSNIPTTSQRLTIKGISKSEINEANEDEDEEKTLKYAKPKERIKNVELDEDDPDCNPASLLMEGVQTADIFSGGKKMIDGSDEMDDHFEALEDLDMREVTRSTTQTQSIFKADISVEVDHGDQEEEDLEGVNYPYDEWDYKNKRYNKNWCSLNEFKIKKPRDLEAFKQREERVLKENHKEIKRLRRNIEQIILQRRPRNRQSDGPEIDIDALINAKADIISGHTPNPNLYISKRKAPSDISILLLIDSSLSADSWVKGRRVMDIAKDSILVMAEVLDGLFENTMVASFYSNTRRNNSYHIVKNFSEKWSSCSAKLEEVKPSGYTRIGVALRHSFSQFEKVKTKRKIVLLLSDGKPTDYDAYEGKLGISDVRQSVREGNVLGIDIFSLAIDNDAKFYFPQLFGANNYEVLSSQSTLPEQLIKLFSRMI